MLLLRGDRDFSECNQLKYEEVILTKLPISPQNLKLNPGEVNTFWGEIDIVNVK